MLNRGLRRAALLLAAASACVVDDDCQLNGVCTAGACVCDAPWAGAACTALQFAPASRAAGLNRSAASSWGGSVVFNPADGLFHMHAADMAIGCGLGVWGTGSRVVHATAAALDGTFVADGYATSAEVHNPHAVLAPDGTWLLAHIGDGNWTSELER